MSPRRLPRRATVAGLLVGLVVPVLPGAPAQAQEVPAEPAATAPAAPAAPTLVPRNLAVEVSWTAPADGGSAITDYVVSSTPGPGCTAPAPQLTCTVTGLTNGVEHAFTVAAVNAVGQGAFSDSAVATPTATSPGAPAAPTAAAGKGSATVSWEPPTDDGGFAVTGYAVTTSPGGAVTRVGAGFRSTVVSPLTNGTPYTFTVTATNDLGDGRESPPSASVTPADAPGAPTVTAATPGSTTVALTWTPGAANGSTTSGYTLTADPGGAACTTTGTSCTVGGLTNGSPYSFSVVASSDQGPSAPSAGVTATPAGPPSAPVVTSVAPGDGELTATWTDGTADGTPVTGHTATARTADDAVAGTCTPAAGASTCTVTGLVNGTAHTVTVTAASTAGSTTSAPSDPVVPAGAPSAPVVTGLAGGDGTATVTWSPAVADGTPVTGHTVTGLPGGTCSAPGDATRCTVGSLVNGTSYTFTVTAHSAAGDTTSAVSGAVVPAGPPSAPAFTSVLRGDGQVALQWIESVPDGAAVSGYDVTGTPGGTCRTTGLSCLVTGLTNGVEHVFTVTARSSGGDTTSAASTPVVPAGAPSSPVITSLVRGDQQVTVGWTAATPDGTPVTGYTVRSSSGAVCTAAGDGTSCTVRPLVNGTSYTFTVTAHSDAGSTPSATSAAVTPAAPPSAPVITSAERGDEQLTVTWTAATPAGTPVTGYTVEVRTSAGTLAGTCGPAPDALTCTVTGLVNGTGYTATVTARSDAGATTSAPSATVTPAGPPSAPVLRDVVRGDRQITVSWTAATADGTPVTGYTATVRTADGTAVGSCGPVGDVLSCTVSPLVNGTAHTATVTAHSTAGSTTSAPSGEVTPAAAPSAPVITSALSGDRRITVGWDAAVADGTPVTGYTATARTADGAAATTCSTDAVTLTCRLTALRNGTPYTVVVTAWSDAGSTTSAPSTEVVPAGVPFAPATLTATRGDQEVVLRWDAADANGSTVTGYTAVSTTDPAVGCRTRSTDAAPLTCTVPSLTNGTAYAFTVTAQNALGSSVPSDPATVTPAGRPFAPPTTGVERGDQSAAVTWGAADGNGSPVTSYRVASTTDPLVGCTPEPAVDPATGELATGCTVTGLTNGVSYVFTVTATNDVGAGQPATTSAVTPARVPSAPADVTAERSDLSARVSWTASGNGGSPVTDYTVTASPGGASQVVSGASTTALVSGLVNGTRYTFTVVAANDVGDSLAGTSNEVVPAGTPAAPVTVAAARGDLSAIVSWTAADANGSPITDYTVVSTTDPTLGCTTTSTSTDPAPLSCTVTGLTNGTPYAFTVVSTNDVDSSSASAPSDPVVPAGTPAAPATVAAARGDLSAIVSWTAADANGSPITDYTVVSTTDPTLGCTTTSTSTDPAPLSCTVTGLTNGTPYAFTVVATNDVDSSSASAPSDPVVPAGVPFAATGVSAVRGDGSATVTWTAAPDNGDPVTSYTVTSAPHRWTCTTTGATGCTVGKLTNGVSYTFTVTARNTVGTGASSAASPAVVPAGLPGTPSGVVATPGDTRATVEWAAAKPNGSAVTGYTVTSTPDGRTCTSVLLSCSITGLRNGTSYTFAVVARNGVGDGAPSAASAAVVPFGTPFPPTGVSAVRGHESATVSWTASTDNGRAVTGYTVTSAPGGRQCTATDAGGCTVPGLTNGTAYAFTVTATNLAGQSAPSDASSPVVPATRPSAPTDVVGTRGDTTVALRWAAPDGNGEPVTGYTVTSEPDARTCTSATAACTVSGLRNGQPYTFTVAATNAVGPGAASLPSEPVVPATSPSTPGTPSAVRGDRSATVTWTAAPDGGDGVTGYTVTSEPAGRTCSTDGALTCTVDGLTNGRSYVFTVQASNGVDAGAVSAPSAPVVPAAAPSAPTGVRALPDDRSAHVSWSASAANGSALSGYVVRSSPGGLTCSTAGTVCTVEGLTNGTSYSFTVTATNDVGSTTSTASAAVVPADVPSAPTSVSVVWHDSAATLTWAPAADGGAPVLRYDVTTAVSGSSCNTAGTTCRVEGLRNGTPYTFTVTAHNAMGEGAPSAVTDAVVPAGVPLAPTAVTAEPADRSATVRWSAAPDNGRPVLSQTVRAVPSQGQGQGTVVVEVPAASTSTVVAGLENGTRYAFTVTATNEVGAGATSAPSASVMPVASPEAATSVTAVPGDQSALVSWTAADDNGVAITGYTVTSSPDGAVCTTTTTSCTVDGLANGRAYVFSVLATNAVGTGPASAPSEAVTPAGLPTAPTGVVAVAGDGTAQVSWTAGEGNGSPVVGHTVRSSPGGLTCEATAARSCTVTGLANGTAYAFTVTARNGIGTGAASTPSDAVVPATVPGAADQVSALAGDASAQVSWSAAPDGGSAVSAYTVTSSPGALQCATTGATTCTVTGLTNGTDYRFSVVAANRLGAGPASVDSDAVVPATPPAAPTAVRAVPGDGAAQVSWTAPADGGRPVTGYTVTSSPGDLQCRTVSAAACTVTGLTNGTAYTFTVTATNAVGTSAASAPSSAVTPAADAPELPPPPPDGPDPVEPAPTDPSPGAPAPGPTARSIDAACPAGQVPPSGFTDVPAGGTHTRAVDCLVWWGVANGRTATSYAPSAGVTRDAMAAFVARTVLRARPGSLPAAPPNAFTDDDASVHALAIDQLAAVGIVGGTGGGRYTPGAVVTRGQMAKFLAGAVAHVLGTPLVAERDLFTDDTGSPFEADINRVAAVGITGGRTVTTYDPTGPVLRDQMGSFLARTLDLFVERGASVPQ